jgi:hypothetical protein
MYKAPHEDLRGRYNRILFRFRVQFYQRLSTVIRRECGFCRVFVLPKPFAR